MSPRRPPNEPLVAIDLFAGAGGLTEGFRRAGYVVPFALDIDHESCETFRLNHPDTDVAECSITELTPAEIARRSGSTVDVVIGGPSCQGFSTARKNRWHDPESERNLLWQHMLAVVKQLKPRAFVIENVPGMVAWKTGNFGDQILKEFRGLGYTVSEPRILLAADYGVPQRRRRLFIVGIRGKQKFQFPEPTHMGGWRRDTLDHWEVKREAAGLYRHLSCWETIADLPLLEGTTGLQTSRLVNIPLTPIIRRLRGGKTIVRDHEVFEIGEDQLSLIHHVPQGGTWRDIPRHLLPDRFRGMRRTDSSNLLGRLDPNLPAYTITTQFNNVTVGCNTHPFEDRALTIREGARLQTFPDRYQFVGSLTSRARQIGNAVPPLLAEVLAVSIAQQLGANVEAHKGVKPAALIPNPPTSEAVRQRLSRQAKKDTKPETLLRDELKKLGITEFDTDVRPLPDLRRTADLAFRDERLAVFVDGCFWHGCPQHHRDTKSNTKWWREKIDNNKRRDAETTTHLQTAGWTVERVWEHEQPAAAAQRIAELLEQLRSDDAPASAAV